MFDFLRNLTQSASEKRRARISAYVDNELTAADKAQFEADLATDADLQAEVESLRQIKVALRHLPRVAVPRNFILDPAQFQPRPRSARSAAMYPALRAATALAAFFFVILLATTLIQPQFSEPAAGLMAEDTVAQSSENAADSNAEPLAEPPALPEDEEAAVEVLVETETVETFATDGADGAAEETEIDGENSAPAAEPATTAADSAEVAEEGEAAPEAESGAGDEVADADVADDATAGAGSAGGGSADADSPPAATITAAPTTAADGDESFNGDADDASRVAEDATPTAIPTAVAGPPRPEASPTLPPRAGTDVYEYQTVTPTPTPPVEPPQPVDPWPILTAISGGLLLLLAGLTYWLRRRL